MASALIIRGVVACSDHLRVRGPLQASLAATRYYQQSVQVPQIVLWHLNTLLQGK